MNPTFVFLLFLVVRLASVFLVQTFYVPDEYWQSVEVAHKLIFGYGYLTWEWLIGVRSYIYPVLLAGVYKLLELTSLDTVNYLVLTPRILQAILSAYSDYRFYVWCGKKKWSVFLIIMQFFWFYTASRTLANTFETALTTIALSYFPWQKEGTFYVWLAGICCFMRPTAGIIWIPLSIYHLNKSKLSSIGLIVKRFIPIGMVVAAIGISIDSYFYGRILITPWEFIKYNYFNNIGSFYGVHPWYWYFLTGLPTVLGINFIPFLFGMIATIRHREIFPIRKCILITVLIALIALSTVEHKEFRFVLVLLPLCLYICTDTLARWSTKAPRNLVWCVAMVILAGNLVPAWYLGLVHQKGSIEVMPRLADIAKIYRDENNNRANILFLMPCHSTPYYSHIHQNITMRFLKCEPNLQNKDNYVDEADEFYKTPDRWLRSHLPSYPKTALPTHLVLYEPLKSKITDFLVNYNIVHTVEHSEYFTERTGARILVYERISPKVEKNSFNTEYSENNMNG